jgi:hypothetical protein
LGSPSSSRRETRKLGLGAEAFGSKAKKRGKTVHRIDLYPKVLIRPICGGCGTPMILGRSTGKYQSFFCFNATNDIKGCTSRGYKLARIIEEAVLGASWRRSSATVLRTGAF